MEKVILNNNLIFISKNSKVMFQLSSVQSLSHVQLFATPWIAARSASLSITNSRSLLKLIHRVGDAIQPSHPLSSPSPAPNPSQHQSLFQESTLRMRWPKYWSFSFSIIPSKEIPGLISFRMDWLDLSVYWAPKIRFHATLRMRRNSYAIIGRSAGYAYVAHAY